MILLRAREAASLVLNLQHTQEERRCSNRHSYPSATYQNNTDKVPPPASLLPEEAVLHLPDFLYELLPLAFPREELPVLEVVKHHHHQTHLVIRLEKEHSVELESIDQTHFKSQLYTCPETEITAELGLDREREKFCFNNQPHQSIYG